MYPFVLKFCKKNHFFREDLFTYDVRAVGCNVKD